MSKFERKKKIERKFENLLSNTWIANLNLNQQITTYDYDYIFMHYIKYAYIGGVEQQA
jgi:hypothetical protein